MAPINNNIPMLASNEDLEVQEAALKKQVKEMGCMLAEQKHKIQEEKEWCQAEKEQYQQEEEEKC